MSVQWAVGGACPTYCQTSVGSATVAGTRGTRQQGSESDSPRSNLKHRPHVLPDPTCLVLNFEFSFDDGSSPNALFSSVLAYFCVYFRDAGCRDEPCQNRAELFRLNMLKCYIYTPGAWRGVGCFIRRNGVKHTLGPVRTLTDTNYNLL